MTVYIGCDHGGLELKAAIKDKLTALKYEVKDLGTYTTDSGDYPDLGLVVAKSVAADPNSRGIVICKTGVGMSIVANKVKGVRCGLCFNAEMAKLCREHNNANCLALGAANTDIPTALDIVASFISTDFSGGRHATRVVKITAYEESHE